MQKAPKTLTLVERVQHVDTKPSFCEVCTGLVSVGHANVKGVIHLTLGCLNCGKCAMYKPEPPYEETS